MLGEKDEASFSFDLTDPEEEKRKAQAKKVKVVKKPVAAPPKQEPIVPEDALNIVRNRNGQFIVRKPGELSGD